MKKQKWIDKNIWLMAILGQIVLLGGSVLAYFLTR